MAAYMKPLLHGKMLPSIHEATIAREHVDGSIHEATIVREHVDGSVHEATLHGKMLIDTCSHIRDSHYCTGTC